MWQNGRVDAIETQTPHATLPFLTEAEREASLNHMLARWNGRDPVWVFAYGSLIWHPEFAYDIKVRGVVYGFHRSLCLWSRVYRGTPERPGLVLGLEPGGCCRGVAFRLPATQATAELRALWAREMTTGSYIPRWLDVRTQSQGVQTRFPAIGFVMNRHASGYAGELDRTTLLETIRTACGQRGTSAEYLLSTVKCLSEYGIHDRHLADLAEEISVAAAEPTPAEG